MAHQDLEDYIGRFVQSSQNDLGTGKIASLTSTTAEIEYFHSISKRHRVDVSLESLRGVKLPHQTRCYIWL